MGGVSLTVEDLIDPAAMSEDQLRAEVWYWRENAAMRVSDARDAVAAGGAQAMRNALSEWTCLLDGAATGDEVDKCFACREVLVPGQPVIRDVSEGEAHAGCMGTHIDGDRYQLDPEGIVDENDEPLPGTDGILNSHPRTPWKSTAEIAALLTSAWGLLGGKGEAQ